MSHQATLAVQSNLKFVKIPYQNQSRVINSFTNMLLFLLHIFISLGSSYSVYLFALLESYDLILPSTVPIFLKFCVNTLFAMTK